MDDKFYKFTVVESHGSSRVLRPKIVVNDAENGPKFNLYHLWRQTVMAATQTILLLQFREKSIIDKLLKQILLT